MHEKIVDLTGKLKGTVDSPREHQLQLGFMKAQLSEALRKNNALLVQN